ncbi:polysaccharide deacetylase family protein [uncultured Winogradskyella sp.]|uniref:polysaccharide deacetylase family protein n=1 Tax=uncultured Winogradskyella sp. TaxID=395353 RepID=UPI00261F9C9F|nr:polysaccharide deacetylase family protein [uncultured Winogradskyella sp.]
MQIIPAKTPDFVKALFPNFIWNINTKNKEIYLTFDDGPTPEITNWVLDLLNKFDAKATFFCIGSNIDKHPDIFNTIIKEGHSIGNHTYNHLKGWKHKTKVYLNDIEDTQALINRNISLITNKDANSLSRVKLFRPPYGKFKSKQSKLIQNLGYKIILWDVLSYDWDKSISEEACLNNVITAAKEGSIIVFHDSIKAFPNLKYALPKVLEHFSNQGFRFKRINEAE